MVQGSPSSPKVLRDAGAADADLMVAVTASDEISNMVPLAKWAIHYLIRQHPEVRIRKFRIFIVKKTSCSTMKIYLLIILISPENLVTDEITRLIAYPGALQVAPFCQ